MFGGVCVPVHADGNLFKLLYLFGSFVWIERKVMTRRRPLPLVSLFYPFPVRITTMGLQQKNKILMSNETQSLENVEVAWGGRMGESRGKKEYVRTGKLEKRTNR